MEGLELLLYSENIIKDSEDTNVDIPKRRMNVRTGSRIRLYVEVIRLLEGSPRHAALTLPIRVGMIGRGRRQTLEGRATLHSLTVTRSRLSIIAQKLGSLPVV